MKHKQTTRTFLIHRTNINSDDDDKDLVVVYKLALKSAPREVILFAIITA